MRRSRSAVSRQRPVASRLLLGLSLSLLGLPCALWALDCNGNGSDDALEVTAGDAVDCNGNGVPDECDVASLSFQFFTTIEVGGVASMLRPADLDGDGNTDLVVGHRGGLSIVRDVAPSESAETVEVEIEATVSAWRAGDLDGDDTLDFVARGEANFHVLWGGDGGVSPGVLTVEAPPGIQSWDVGDVSGDGTADVVFTDAVDGGRIVVLVSVPGRALAEPRAVALAPPADSLVLLDLDEDQTLDAVTLNEDTATLSLLRSVEGSFAVARSLPAGTDRPEVLLAADFDGDGLTDLAVSGRSGRAVFLQRSGGELEGPFVFESARGLTRALAVGDLDRDGDADLVGVFGLGEPLAAFLNGGDGSLQTSLDLPGGGRPRHLSVADFDDDGDVDVAVSSISSRTVTILWNGDPRGNAVVSMARKRVIELPGPPHSIQAGDIDNDGAMDVVVIDGGNRVFLLKNDGFGNLLDPRMEDGTLLAVNGGPFWSLTVGEFDGDGALDLAIVDGSRFHQDFQNFAHVLLNGGDATFAGRTSYPVGEQTSHATTADLDGDGLDEILTTAARENALRILPNLGDGTFGEANSIRVGSTPFSSVAEDLDGDGDNDIVVANWISGELTVLFNDGAGQFPETAIYPVVAPVFSGTIDVDSDGDLDLVVASNRDLVLFENDDMGMFTEGSKTRLVNAPRSLTVAEMDGDGRPDVVTSSETGHAVAIVLNAGGGRLIPALEISVGVEPRFAAVTDLDGDGDLDVVSANHGTFDVTVLHNQRTVVASEAFLHQICTFRDFDLLSLAVTRPIRGRVTKYVLPADEDPALVSAVFQNMRESAQHVEFLATYFPQSFPAQAYEELVAVRASRRYFAGSLYEVETQSGAVYAFSVITAIEQDPTEGLTLDEVRAVRQRLSAVFSLGPLAYLPDSARAREAAEAWEDPGFDVFLDLEDDGPATEPPPDQPTPTFQLEVRSGTEACGVFVHSRSSRAAYELKSRLRFVSDRVELETVSDRFEATLLEDVFVGPQQERAEAAGPGMFQLARFAQGETTSYRFRYDQTFLLSGGRRFEVTLFNLTFRARGNAPLDDPLVLDERALTEGLQLQGIEDLVVSYASCSYERLPLWEIGVDLADGGQIRLLERYEPPVPGETGPAALVSAELDLAGLRRSTSSYWELVYSASRHNRSIEYWVVLEPPVDIPGVERPVRVVEVVAPDDLFEVTPAVRYLDEDFVPLRSFDVTAYRRERAPESPPLRRGDVLRDGAVNVADIIAILGHLFRRQAVSCVKAADTNDDGRVNIIDPILLAQSLFGGGAALPPPAAECGLDPTPDELSCEALGPCGG